MTPPPALCHIDGHPCPRARECRMMPYDVCANYCERSAPTLTEAGCRVCIRLRHGKCHGFSCYLAPARPIHKTILADASPRRDRPKKKK